jgi:hypothetical protein
VRALVVARYQGVGLLFASGDQRRPHNLGVTFVTPLDVVFDRLVGARALAPRKMSLNAVDTTRARRTEDELRAMVEAIHNSAPGIQETNWLEWKRTLDLTTPEGRSAVSKAVLGFANRAVEEAQLACEGVAYMVVGVEPGTAAGVPNFDHATLGQKIKTYVDGPRWTPHYVAFSGVTVLVIVVEVAKTR